MFDFFQTPPQLQAILDDIDIKLADIKQELIDSGREDEIDLLISCGTLPDRGYTIFTDFYDEPIRLRVEAIIQASRKAKDK
jgi:hypothetical protein